MNAASGEQEMDDALPPDGIAIIGMAGRLPGARDLRAFWRNLCDGVESITHFTPAEIEDAFTPAQRADPAYVPARSVIEGVELFDPGFFGMHAREAMLMDPQHRVFLECCWEVFEDAGYDPAGTNAGVFAGCSMPTYLINNVFADRKAAEAFTSGYQVDNYHQLLGSLSDALATRVSYKLDLRGPSMTVQTACSTSLVAVVQACQALLLQQCDMALAGGVSITLPQHRGYRHTEGGMVSADGHCRPFDADASGTVFGSGCGVVLLKRLADALVDGDRIYAVVKGSAINNDGAVKAGFTAPSVDAQAAVVAIAHAVAGIDAATIRYVECHGTATPLGDPIEVAALTRAFRETTDEAGFCAIGSVKGNVGHLDVAAGVTGLIKAALAVQAGVIPPTMHYATPNPRLGLDGSPFFVADHLTRWSDTGHPRRAGVSALGVGGTNVHVVLEEAPPAPMALGRARTCEILTLSARSEAALACARAALAERLRDDPALNLADVAHTLRRRRSFPHRCVVAACDAAEAVTLLTASRVPGGVAAQDAPPVLFVFPGQGSQYPDMAAGLYRDEPVFRAEIDRCAEILLPMLQLDLRTILYGNAAGAADAVRQTLLAQPAIFVVSYALAKLWMSWGIRPAAMLGHSVGEFVAACLAGVLRLEDALGIVAARGRLMQSLPGGAMLAVRLPEAELRPLLPAGLDVAAVNGPALCVVAGEETAVASFEQALQARAVTSRRLHTSHAFHSAMMEPILAPLAEAVRPVPLGTPDIPYVSCVTGTWIAAAEAQSPDYWARHCRAPVRFADGLATLLAAQTTPPILLEVGPGATLGSLARASGAPRGTMAAVLASLPDAGDAAARGGTADAQMMAQSLGALWAAGVAPDWRAAAGPGGRQISLPTYAFERTRHWVDAPAPQAQAQTPGLPAEALPMPQPAIQEVRTVMHSREAEVRNAILATMQGLSGEELAQVDDDVTFLELGFDSLLLSQAAQELQGSFGVKISFRQLLGDLSTVPALAGFICAALPEAPVQAAVPVAVPAPVAASTPSAAPPPAALAETAVERLLQSQLETMQQVMAAQLTALRGLDRPEIAAPTPAPVLATAAPAPASTSVVELTNRFRRFTAPPHAANVDTELTGPQRHFLAELIRHYTARTAKSKALTQADRAVLADPRAASGFRPEWKELVYPIVCDRAAGSRLWDIDGNDYIDLVNGFGPTAFGHSPDFVVDAVAEQLRRGFAIGPQSDLAGKVAALISELTGDERVTFCCTGSEAVMGALRISRAVTGRKRVVAFAGAYHGGFDEVLVRGVRKDGAPRSLPAASGIMPEAVANLTILEYAEPESLEWIRAHADELAAVLVEPVQSRHPDLQPRAFLQEIRAITEASGTALIFDEVVTGFRLHPGGAQALFDIRADLATYGKVLGGGLPIGILAGKSRFMDALDGGFWRYGDASAPEVAVTVFAGTFVRHPLSLAAALAVLHHMKAEGPALQRRLGETTAALAGRLNAFLAARGIRSRIEHCGSMFHFNPSAEDRNAGLLFYLLRARGIYVQENFPLFLTTAHDAADIAAVADAFEGAIADLQAVGILGSEAVAVASAPPADVKPQILEAPLTEPQLEIWLSAQLGDDASCAYNESLSLTLAGPLDAAALRGALDDLMARHDALRSRFAPSGDIMVIDPLRAMPLTEVDAGAGADPQAAFAALLAEEAHRPFDLTGGPLVRAVLVRHAEQEHVLVLTAHHIICDGWSTNVMLNDLAALYDNRRSGRTAPLPDALSFAQHAVTERTADMTLAATADEAYWLQHFATLPAPLELPGDRPRPVTKTFHGATVREQIDATLYSAVRRAGARAGCTPFTTMLAAFQALMGRLSGQEEIVVGVPTAGQSLLEAGALVGHCVNFLPIRARWDETTTLAEHMIAVQGTLVDAREHPRCTLGTLVRRLNVPRDPNRMPLTDVQFNLERVAAPAGFGGLKVATAANGKAFVNFDLFFNLVETGDGVRIECDYSTDLFDEATVRRWIGHYRTLLTALAADTGTLVVRTNMLSEPERHALLVAPNATAAEVNLDRGFHELFAEQVVARPDAIAAECGDSRWTYRELDRRAEEIAAHLSAQVQETDARIGVLMDRSLDMLAALLAVAKAGFAYVPLDPHHPPARLRSIIERSCPAALLTDGLAPVPENLSVQTIDLSGRLYPVAVRREPGVAAAASPLAYVIYTSGSTGIPKGVEVTHRALTNLLLSMARTPGLGADDALLAVTTVTFDIAALELFLPLTVGARVVIAHRDEVADGFILLAKLRAYGITVLQGTPATWQLLLEAGFRSHPGLKMLCGGEALSRELADRLLEGGGALWNMYGPTETTIWSSCLRVEADGGPVTIGWPIANTRFYLLDRHGEPTPQGAVGQLHIAGEGLAAGYFRDPAQTAAQFVADPFVPDERMYRTGDLARRLPDGAIQMLGRLDSQLKLRGFRIDPTEIEGTLQRIGGVSRAAVVLRQDPPRMPRLVCYYVEAAGAPRIPAELKAMLTEVLPHYMVPSAYVRLAALPLTPNGKVDQRALPAPEESADTELRTTPRVALQTPLQQTLGAIWQEVLGIEDIGAEDDLLGLGADSIHIFQIAARISRAGIPAAAKDLLRHRTIAALSAALDNPDMRPTAATAGGPPKLSQFRRADRRV
jgi:amino acid adenylation domain-containing protein